MERKGFLARLKPEYREQYIEAHNNISEDLLGRYRRAGIRNISIFLMEEQLFMYVEAESFETVQNALSNDPVDLAWQKLVSPMKNPDSQQMLEIFHME